MMMITTSRKPSQQTRAIARTLADALGAGYLNRGKSGVESVLAEAEKAGAGKVLFVWERHGNPSRLVGFDLEKAGQSIANPPQTPQGETEENKKKDSKNLEKEEKGTGEEKKNEKVDENDFRDENEKEDASEDAIDAETQKEAQSGWLSPEVGIHGAVFNRRPIRHKGARIIAQDPFGEAVAGLLDARDGPNQILLSRSGLKIVVDTDLVLELKFRR